MKYKLSRIFLIISLFITSSIYAKEYYDNLKISKLISVYDGDSFRVDIDTLPSLIGKNISIRIKGIDTPEIRAKCNKEKELAIKAKELTLSILSAGKTVELRNLQRGKYFRIVADVYVDGKSLADIQLKNNLAVLYQGGKKIKN